MAHGDLYDNVHLKVIRKVKTETGFSFLEELLSGKKIFEH